MNKYAVAGMVAVVLAGIAQGAAAQDPAAKSGGPASPWYFGLGLGWTDASIPEQTIDGIDASFSAANGAAFSTVNKDKSSTAGKLFAGYRFNRNFAVEVGYAALGNSEAHMNFYSAGPVSTSVGTFDVKYKMSAAFIDAVGMLPVGEQWSFFGRVGVSYNRVSADVNGQPVTAIVSANDQVDTKVREKFGAGVDYNLNSAYTVRAEWELYKMPDPLKTDEEFNANTATVSLLIRF